jgi:aryl-alcohol dehydrogenase-like predicted oxidoreductase
VTNSTSSGGQTIGARNAKQVDGIIGVATFRVTADEIKEIEAAL